MRRDQACIKFPGLQRLESKWKERRSEPKGFNPQEPSGGSHVLRGAVTSILGEKLGHAQKGDSSVVVG